MRILLSLNYIIMFICIGISASVFVFAGVFQLLHYLKYKGKTFNDDPTLNYDQSYTIDLRNDEVKSFNLKTFRPLNHMSIKSFLKKFLPESRNKIETWVNNFISLPIDEDINEERRVLVANYILSKKVTKNSLKICKCLLLCTNVDLSKKKVTIEMELLLNTTNSYNKKHLLKQFLYSASSMQTSYEKGYFNHGAFICVDIKVKPNSASVFNDLYLKTLMINALFAITSTKDTKVFYMGDSKRICILDSRQLGTFGLNKFINKIKETLVDLLDIRGINAYYDY